jgi:hypothetical protein
MLAVMAVYSDIRKFAATISDPLQRAPQNTSETFRKVFWRTFCKFSKIYTYSYAKILAKPGI